MPIPASGLPIRFIIRMSICDRVSTKASYKKRDNQTQEMALGG